MILRSRAETPKRDRLSDAVTTMESAPIVVTGVNGFVGRHLVRELTTSGHPVLGLGREEEPAHEVESDLFSYVAVDLSASWPRLGEIAGIVHLAGLASVGDSFDRPQEYIEVNSRIVTNMCEGLLSEGRHPRIVGVSSGAVYDSTGNRTVDEVAPVAVTSPYAVSKLLVENQLTYYSGRGLDCVIARPFNHAGPGQGPGYLIPDLIEAISRSMEDKSPAQTGLLTTVRDYTDVRDVVRAYRMLCTANSLDHRLYNICSGRGLSGEAIFALVREKLGAADVSARTDESALRPSDPSIIVGDPGRITADVGWSASIPIAQTIRDAVLDRRR